MKYVWMAIKGLLVLALFLAMLHMWPDEDLDPELQRWRAHRPGGAVAPENLYYGLFGFAAPYGQDPFTAGREQVERYITFGLHPDDDYEDGLQISGELEALGISLPYEDAIPLLDEMESQHSELLTRYLMLHAVRDQNFPMQYSWSVPYPNFYRFSVIQRLVHLRILERVRSGDPNAVAWGWDTLATQLAVHRRFYANSNILMERVIFGSMVERDLELYAKLMALPVADGGAVPPRLPSALSVAERSMLAPLRNEASFIEFGDEEALWNALIHIDGSGGWEIAMARFAPFNFNETVNIMARHAYRSAELSMLSAAEFHQRVGELDYEEPGVWDWMTNSLGTIAFAVSVPNNAMFIYATHDLDAKITLLKIAARARAEGVTEAALPVFLETLGPSLRNPYDDSAAVYEDGYLRFEVLRGTGITPEIAFTPDS
jgi:hypothetical protein